MAAHKEENITKEPELVDKDKDSDKDRDKERDGDGDRNKDKDKERDGDSNKDKDKERDGDGYRNKDKEMMDTCRDRYKDKDKERDGDGYRNKDKEMMDTCRDRYKDKDGDGDKDKDKDKDKAPEEGPLRDEARGQRKCTTVLKWLVVLALPIILAILGGYFYFKADLETPPERIRVFNESFDQLKASFPRQTPRFWRILRNRAFAHLNNPNPKKALVFMFTAAPSAHTVLECIARRFAQSLQQEDNGVGYINSKEYYKYSSLGDAKKILDETLKGHLQKRRTVLIFDVDKLPEQCPLLFYQYCDNENAPYKHAAIIFTVRLPLEPNSSLEPAKKEGLVAKYLKETWGKQDYRPDDIPPLVTRMRDTVVMVNEESDQTLKKNCGI